MFELNLYSKTVLVVVFFIVNLVLIILLGSKNTTSRAFAAFAFSIALWGTSRAFFHGAEDVVIATYINKISFFIGNIIAMLFFLFTSTFPDNKLPSRKILIFIFLSFIVSLPIYFIEPLFLGKALEYGGIQRWTWEQGPYLFFFDIIFLGYWLAGLINLFKKIPNYSGETKTNLKFMAWGMAIAITPPAILTIILPRYFDFFKYDWTSSITLISWVLIIFYSIVKYNQMSVRTVSSEIFIFISALLLLINIFL